MKKEKTGKAKPKKVSAVKKGSRETGETSVRWCITEGWGNLGKRYLEWQVSKDEEEAYRRLSEEAKSEFPRTFNEVWTQTFVEGGVVCDFGDHRYFGFIEGVPPPFTSTPSYAVANGTPEPLKPSVSASRTPPEKLGPSDYLMTTWGRALSSLFEGYLRAARSRGGEWWTSHALEYCIVSEWWEMFCEDDPDISAIWERDLSPEDVFNGVLDWASNCTDAPEILLLTQTDSRWDAFKAGLMYGSRRG